MDKLLILTYHAVDTRPSVISVSPEMFLQQMEQLAKHGLRGIGLAEAFAHHDEHGRFSGAQLR